MEAKLTLSMDALVIKRAKEFAKKNQTSLSQLIEDYFTNLTKKEKGNDKEDISPLVRDLSGVLKLPNDFDFKKDRTHHLDKKNK